MLRIEDKLAIIELLERFALFVDCGDAKAMSDLFTENGSFESRRQAHGRKNVFELFKENFEERKSPNYSYKNGIHICSVPVLDGDESQAVGLSHYVYVLTSSDAPPYEKDAPFSLRLGFDAGQPTIARAGMYRDQYSKVGGTWLIARRETLTDVPDASSVPGQTPH